MRKNIIGSAIAAALGCFVGSVYERQKLSFKDANVLHAATAQLNHPEVVPIEKYQKSTYTDVGLDRFESIITHGVPSLDNLRNYKSFLISYDRRNRNANWVFEHLNEGLLKYKKREQASRKDIEFFEDQEIHEFFRSSNKDFKGSGYDRGHLAAAGNYQQNFENLQRTFVLSNISPQVGNGFNRDIWCKLEKYVRYRAANSKNTWVCTGPLYLPRKTPNGKNYVVYEVIGKNNVAVPTHFFKVLLVENKDGTFDLESYMMQNSELDENIPLKAFQVPVEQIERASGLLFFNRISKKQFKSINGPNPYLNKFMTNKKKNSHSS